MHASPQPAMLLAAQIQTLLREYGEHPLKYMRERNLQIRLGNLLESALGHGKAYGAAEIAHGRGRREKRYPTRDQVARVQHELKIAEAGGRQMSDIVLLRCAPESDPIRLTRKGYGHLDIVAAIRAYDAEAVIEIKAACSADEGECRKFRSDVQKLHALIKSCQGKAVPAPECHFVLIDKSMPIREHASCVQRQRDLHWDAAKGRAWSWAGAGRLGKSHVHVWDFDSNGQVRHRVSVA